MPGLTILRNGAQAPDPNNNVIVHERHRPQCFPVFDVTVTKGGSQINTFTCNKAIDAIDKAGQEAVRHGFPNQVYIVED